MRHARRFVSVILAISLGASATASSAAFASEQPGGTDRTAASGESWDVRRVKGPSSRIVAAMAFDGASGDMVLFGGRTRLGFRYDDTWTWDGITWTQLQPATSPAPRFGHAMAYDPGRDQVVLFGGLGSPGCFDDTWTYAEGVWTELDPATSPGCLNGAAMAYDPNLGAIVLFGGWWQGYSHQTWMWDGTTWTRLNPTEKPAARSHAGFAYDPSRDALVLFGGDGALFRDTWAWDGTTWTRLNPTKKPPAQSAMGLSTFGGRVAMFDVQGDTYVLGPTTWERIDTATSPKARYGETFVWDPIREEAVLFGGDTGGDGLHAYRRGAWVLRSVDP